MLLHGDTYHALRNPSARFSEDLQDSVTKLLDLLEVSSPMSDINYVLYKNNMRRIPGIKFPRAESSWMPIRNVLRILAYIATLDHESSITEVYIRSMSCGCDSFSGTIRITFADDTEVEGRYEWRWTSFPGRPSFDKFTEFPSLSTTGEIALGN